MGKNRRRTLYRALNGEGKSLSSNDYHYMINQIKCSGIKQRPFCMLTGFVGQKCGKSKTEMVCLCSSMSGASSGKSWRLEVTRWLGSRTTLRHFQSHRCRCRLLPGIPAGAVNPSTSTSPCHGTQVSVWSGSLEGVRQFNMAAQSLKSRFHADKAGTAMSFLV